MQKKLAASDSVSFFKKAIAVTSAIALVSGNFVTAAYALPTGCQVVAGNATITNTANSTNINQSSHRADINWRDFSSNAGESINFRQPDASAVTINRVIG